MINKVFVYGTLKSGHGANRTLSKDEKLVTQYLTPAQYTMYDCGGFPCLSEGGSTSITGEIWTCSKDTLKSLDFYEGISTGLFKRQVMETKFGKVWVYVGGEHLVNYVGSQRVIEKGEW